MKKVWWLGLIGFAPLVFGAPRPLRLFLLFFLVPLISDAVSWARSRGDPKNDADEGPLPGPARKYGAAGLTMRYHLSATLAVLNPFQLIQMLRQMAGEARAASRAGSIPPAAVTCALPFDGEWLAANGGITAETSHSWDLIGQRYAYDFLIADASGEHHRGEGTKHEDYFCYGQPIRAVLDGVVTSVRDGVRDAPRVGTGWVDWLAQDFGGNSVTIRHDGVVHSYSAHLIPGSIPVSAGHQVRKGDIIGRCGNSGHSTEPHLHFQLQDGPDSLSTIGLPIRFERCLINGLPADPPVTVSRGQRVRTP